MPRFSRKCTCREATLSAFSFLPNCRFRAKKRRVLGAIVAQTVVFADLLEGCREAAKSSGVLNAEEGIQFSHGFPMKSFDRLARGGRVSSLLPPSDRDVVVCVLHLRPARARGSLFRACGLRSDAHTVIYASSRNSAPVSD